MTSLLITTADLITAAINANEWEGVEPFTPERSFADWEIALDDDDVLHVDVVPVFDPKTELETRGSLLYTMQFDIGVRQRMGPKNRDQTTGKVLTSRVDPLVSFVEAIHDFFATDRFSATDTTWKETEFRAAYSREDLRERHQFLGIVRLTFEGTKDL